MEYTQSCFKVPVLHESSSNQIMQNLNLSITQESQATPLCTQMSMSSIILYVKQVKLALLFLSCLNK